MEFLTKEEKNALEEFRNRMENVLMSPVLKEDDSLCYRFLKARDFCVDEAEKMLQKHIVWRKVYQADAILEIFKPKEVFLKYLELDIIGFDKDGDLVRYLKGGKINNTELMKCIKFHDYMKHWIWLAEKHLAMLKQEAEKTGKMPATCFILDLEGLEFRNATSKITAHIFLGLLHLLQANYPERLKSALIINAPSFYVFVYTILKTVMSNAMSKKIQIFGNNGWKEKLLEIIDADVLPAFLGGTRTDPDGDPYCRSFISINKKISENFYLSEGERYFEDVTEVSTLVIPPSHKKELFVHVKKAGFSIQWKFMVRSKTIWFGLFFEETPNVLKEILPMYEYETKDGTEENSYKCLSKGKYIIIFDNSHSRFYTKEVEYVVSVENPETDLEM